MKILAQLVVIFCASVTVSKGTLYSKGRRLPDVRTWSFPMDDSQHSLSSPNSKILVSVNRVLRQANAANPRECISGLIGAVCSTSFAPNYIDKLSQCDSFGEHAAILFETFCRRNSGGEYCSVGLYDIALNCLSLPTNCSTACRASLIKFGCCSSTIILDTGVDFEEMLSHCGLPILTECPPTSFNIPIPSNNPSCSSMEDLFSLLLPFHCSRQNIQLLLDSQNLNNCPGIKTAILLSCSYRDGKYCVQDPYTSELTRKWECPSKSDCSSRCRSSLENINKNFGCCLNIFNFSLVENSFTAPQAKLYGTIMDNALWQECGITPPEVCEARLNAGPSAYTAAGNSAFLIWTAVICNAFYFYFVSW